MTYLLVERAAPRWVALIAAVLVAIDPLVITYDSRVMLEAPTQLAVVSAFLLLALGAGAPALFPIGPVARSAMALAASPQVWPPRYGLLHEGDLRAGRRSGPRPPGAHRMDREPAGGRCGPRRRRSSATGYRSSPWACPTGSESGGRTRSAAPPPGRHHARSPDSTRPQVHVSIVSRFLADLPTFAVSYLILGFGTCGAALGLLVTPEAVATGPAPRRHRARVTVLVAIWTVSAAAYLVYATLIGTIEEQMYYILLLPSAISLCLWFAGPTPVRDPDMAEGRSWSWPVGLLFDVGRVDQCPLAPG